MNRRILILLAIVLIASLQHSCRDREGDPGLNKKELIDEFIPVTQYHTGLLHGNKFGRLSNIWMQQLAGVRGSYVHLEVYDVPLEYMDEPWEIIYLHTNYRLNTLIDYSMELELPAHAGIAMVTKAMMFSMATDAFGDIPFVHASEFYLGGFPEYDDQELVYEQVNNLLSDGIQLLRSAQNTNAPTPGPETDFIYQGNLNNWIKAANLLRLRNSLRISHEDQNYNHSLIYIQEEDDYFTGNLDNMLFPFDIHADLPNPYYEFDQNIRHVRVGEQTVSMLLGTDDPRLPVFVRRNADNAYVGSAPGAFNQSASYLGAGVASQESPIFMLTYAEQLLIKAEVYLRTGNVSAAAEAYNDALIASLDQYDVFDEAWLVEHQLDDNLELQDIMHAKYLALFLHPEVWSDWRRTGYPELNLAEGSALDEIPRRYPYPQTEHLHNSQNVPEGVTITDRIWWDAE